MSMYVSINGEERVKAHNVVVYDENTPVAVNVDIGGGVLVADAARDTDDFERTLASLGCPDKVKPVTTGPRIIGSA